MPYEAVDPDGLSLYDAYLQAFLDRGVPLEDAETIALDLALNRGYLSPELRELARFVIETYLNPQDAL